jgi:hypothetical protein
MVENIYDVYEGGWHLIKDKVPQARAFNLNLRNCCSLFWEARAHPQLNDFLVSLGYPGTFLAGILYAYGFTSAPATAVLLILSVEQDIFLAGFI